LGSFFLGSTTPDIRAMTKWDRERTHFTPLSVDTIGAGARRMFQLHPKLADSKSQNPETRAFVLGYVSHLVADEVWITTMYRPHFGTGNQITRDEVEAHIWDRALQLDMDRQVQEGDAAVIGARDTISESKSFVDMEFLDAELIQEWQEWVARFMAWDFTWDRLKRALNRMFRDNDDVQQVVELFVKQIPGSMDRVYAKIPQKMITAYQDRVLEETLAQVREYLVEA